MISLNWTGHQLALSLDWIHHINDIQHFVRSLLFIAKTAEHVKITDQYFFCEIFCVFMEVFWIIRVFIELCGIHFNGGNDQVSNHYFKFRVINDSIAKCFIYNNIFFKGAVAQRGSFSVWQVWVKMLDHKQISYFSA